MLRIRKRVTFNVTILVLIIIVIMAIEATGGGFFIYTQINNYKEQISSLTTEITSNKKIILVPNIDITAGQELKLDMFSKALVYASAPQDTYLSQADVEGTQQEKNTEVVEDMKIGRWALIDIAAGTPVLKTMVVDEKISHDLRNEEFNSFLLQSDVAKD